MQRLLLGSWALLLAVAACGGTAPAPESPVDVDASAEPIASGTNDSAPSPADEAAPSASATDEASESARASAGAPASKEDIQAVLQLVLEDEELTPFLHLEEPGRFPVKIAGSLPSGLELVKATKPVEIVDTAEGKKKPVIVFTEIDVGPSRAQVRYRYDVEQVKGASTLEKRDGRWVLVRSRITERQELER